MKPTVSVVAATVVLSLVLWAVYYITSGGIPASTEVTSILVGISLGLVLFFKWLWKLVRKDREVAK